MKKPLALLNKWWAKIILSSIANISTACGRIGK